MSQSSLEKEQGLFWDNLGVPGAAQENPGFLKDIFAKKEEPPAAKASDYANKPVLKADSRGDAVVEVQRLLQRLAPKVGFALPPAFKVDGIYGKNTTQAVVNFQSRVKITPTGITNAATWASLFEAVERTRHLPAKKPLVTGQQAEQAATWLTSLVGPKDAAPEFQMSTVPETPKTDWVPYLAGGVLIVGLAGGLYLYSQKEE